MVQVGDIWYRYEDVQYAASLDEFDNPVGVGRLAVNERQYQVVKVTPKGVRLNNGRVVLDSSNKKFACPTQKLAKESFIKRKERQVSILSRQLERAQKSIQLVKNNRETVYG